MRPLDRRGRRRFRFLYIDLVDLWGRFLRPLLGGGRG